MYFIVHITLKLVNLFSWLQSKDDWVSGDPSLPVGWRLRHVEGIRLGRTRTKCYILSPEGVTFQTRVKALRHLLAQDPMVKEEVERMREVLQTEGWTHHPLLPNAEWRVRQHANKPLQLLSPAAQVYGLSAALAHLVYENSLITVKRLHVTYYSNVTPWVIKLVGRSIGYSVDSSMTSPRKGKDFLSSPAPAHINPFVVFGFGPFLGWQSNGLIQFPHLIQLL